MGRCRVIWMELWMAATVARPELLTAGMATGTECVGAHRRRLTVTATAGNVCGRRTIAAQNWTVCCSMKNVDRMRIAAVDAAKWMKSCADRSITIVTDRWFGSFLLIAKYFYLFLYKAWYFHCTL